MSQHSTQKAAEIVCLAKIKELHIGTIVEMAKHVIIIEAYLHIQTMSALHHFGQRLHCLVYLCVCVCP